MFIRQLFLRNYLHRVSNDTFRASANLMKVDTLPSPRLSMPSMVLTGTPDNLERAGTDRPFSFLISFNFIIKILSVVVGGNPLPLGDGW